MFKIFGITFGAAGSSEATGGRSCEIRQTRAPTVGSTFGSSFGGGVTPAGTSAFGATPQATGTAFGAFGQQQQQPTGFGLGATPGTGTTFWTPTQQQQQQPTFGMSGGGFGSTGAFGNVGTPTTGSAFGSLGGGTAAGVAQPTFGSLGGFGGTFGAGTGTPGAATTAAPSAFGFGGQGTTGVPTGLLGGTTITIRTVTETQIHSRPWPWTPPIGGFVLPGLTPAGPTTSTFGVPLSFGPEPVATAAPTASTTQATSTHSSAAPTFAATTAPPFSFGPSNPAATTAVSGTGTTSAFSFGTPITSTAAAYSLRLTTPKSTLSGDLRFKNEVGK